MTDEAALRAAVIAHPDDDTPRDAYADWLDDLMQPWATARAAFIRTQLALARLPNFRENRQLMERATAGDPEMLKALGEYTALKKLEGEAFAAMPMDQRIIRGGESLAGWSVEFCDPALWHRGFPATIRECGSVFWQRCHADVLAVAPIRRVELVDVPEVEFGLPRQTNTFRQDDRRTDIRTEWEARWGDHRETFTLLTTITREVTYAGVEAVRRVVGQHLADVDAARTPLGYLRMRWEGVEFVVPRLITRQSHLPGHYVPGPGPDFADFMRELNEQIVRANGLPSWASEPMNASPVRDLMAMRERMTRESIGFYLRNAPILVHPPE